MVASSDRDPIQAALERLDKGPVDVMLTDGMTAYVDDCENVTQEFAALIRQATGPHVCNICAGNDREPFAGGYKLLLEIAHAPDCALLALCEVINGRKV